MNEWVELSQVNMNAHNWHHQVLSRHEKYAIRIMYGKYLSYINSQLCMQNKNQHQPSKSYNT